uniref:C2H2-type domain-containing protein n=1 Tax=Anopheles christyi TaxID=43041 RepID=A0A182KDS9_9DIPT
MVYYSGLPLLMTQQQQQQQHGPDGTILQLSYNDTNSAEQYVVAGQPSRIGALNPYQQQQQHHTISLTNGLTISNGPQSCSSSSSNSNGQLTIVLNPPGQSQLVNMGSSTLAGTYTGPISPVGERGAASSPEQSTYPVQASGGSAVSSKFRCDQCNISFGSKSAHTSHMKSHAKQQQQQAGEKPYKCPVEGCGKGFTCSKQLKVHSRTHTGEKPYHCDICFRDFGYNHVLKLHRVQHYGAKCYKCTICDETFKSKKEMEAHIKGHANELPDDEEAPEGSCKLEDVSTSGTEGSAPTLVLEGSSSGSNSNSNSSFDYSSSMSHTEGTEQGGPSSDEPSGMQTSSAGHFTIMKTSSPSPPSVGMNDDGQHGGADEEDEEEEDGSDQKQIPPYDGMGQLSFDHSLQRAYGGGVAPALLAAASIAAAVENGCTEMKFCPEIKQQRSISPAQPSALSISRITPPPSSGSSSSSSSSSSTASISSIPPSTGASSTLLEPSAGNASSAGQYVYEPLAIMKHHGYFAPASQITEFRSSSDIVRQVEAAIAGTENLLTPPRSSPESPDRSSSPESDSVLMANRDNNTLPPRKRKLYFKDSQQQQSHTVPSGPKMAALEITPHHYGVTQQPMVVQQQPSLDTHSGHQQLFPPHPHHHQQQQQQTRQPHFHEQLQPQDERCSKMEVLQHVSPFHRQPSPTPQSAAAAAAPPQTQVAPSVIRMSSVIQYANKSSS